MAKYLPAKFITSINSAIKYGFVLKLVKMFSNGFMGAAVAGAIKGKLISNDY